jgi:hypothetical protein
MEKIGRIGVIKPSLGKKPERSRSPKRDRRSKSRSRSPPRRRDQRSYSGSPPHYKGPRSRSPSPRRNRSPPPRHAQPQKPSSQTQVITAIGPPPGGPPMQPQYSDGISPQYPQLTYAPQYQQPPYPANSGFYREDIPPSQNLSVGWNQRGQYPPPPAQPPYRPQPPDSASSQNYGRFPPPPSSGQERRGSDHQNRNWR